jgi:radical SAM protein (TIGR01212 family)
MTIYYNALGAQLKKQFGCKVYKISLDGGFTCPNRDGSKGVGGCIFCDKAGSSSLTNPQKTSIKEQILNNIIVRKSRYKAKKFIVYLQSYSNTYGSIDHLKHVYDEAIYAHEDIVGISIATRSDCIDDDKAALIASYKNKVPYVNVELGMQSAHETTLKLINRCETHADFVKAIKILKNHNLDHCAHVILGLPNEDKEDELFTADTIAKLKVNGVKIHLLVIIKDTPLEELYRQGGYKPLTLDEYVQKTCNFLERLHPCCVIHRMSTSGPLMHLVAPLWMQTTKETVVRAILEEFKKRNSKQGIFCNHL